MKMIRAFGRQAGWAFRGLSGIAVCLLAACGGGEGSGLDSAAAAESGQARARALAVAPPANAGGLARLGTGTRALRLVSAPDQYLNADGTGLNAPVGMASVAPGAQLPSGALFEFKHFMWGLGSNCADITQRTTVDEVWPPAAPSPNSVTLLGQQSRGLRFAFEGFGSGISAPLNMPLAMGPVTTGWSAGYCASADASGRGFRLGSPFSAGYLTLKDGQLMMRQDDGSAAFAASAVWQVVDLNGPCCAAPTAKIREVLPATQAPYGEPIALRVDAEPGSGLPIARTELFNGFVQLPSPDGVGGAVQRLPVGSYRFFARATSDFSTFGMSAPVDYQVTPPAAAAGYRAPSAVLSASGHAPGPVSMTAGAAVSLLATAVGSSSKVQSVEFLDGGKVVSRATQLPARWSWAASVGTHSVTVRVTDVYGNRTTSPALAVAVAPLPAGSAPLTAVQLAATSAAGTALEGAVQQLTATVGAPLPADAHVEFYDGVDLIGGRSQAPYSIPWSGRVGPHLLTAVVVDAAGRRSSSAPLAFTVTSGAPPPAGVAYPYFFTGIATVDQPASGATGSAGQPLFVTVKPFAGDANAHPLNRVELYVVDLSKLDANNQAPLEFVDSSASAKDLTATTLVWRKPRVGRFALVARVVANHARGVSQSAGVVFREGSNVDAVLRPDLLTQVTIGAAAPAQAEIFSPPADTAVVLGQGLILRARASGSDGTSGTAASVRFLVDGKLIATEGVAGGQNTAWMPNAVGRYSVSAVVTDSVTGKQVTSAPVNLHVVAPDGFPSTTGPFNWAPRVSLTAPANASSVSVGTAVNVRALAEDIGGRITQVVLRSTMGDVELPGVSGSLSQYGMAEYQRSWTAANAGSTTTFWAEATDELGATTFTPRATVSVAAPVVNRPPTVSLMGSPALPTTVSVGTRYVLRAAAADSDGRVVKVEYFNNGMPMGTALQSPWRVDGVATWVGPHLITARATDDKGATTTSTALNMHIVDPGAPKVRVLGSPALPGQLKVGSAFSLRADTSNSAVRVVKVEYFNNGRSMGAATQSPWRLDGKASWVGTHRITARATDEKGTISLSPEVLMQIIAAP